MKKNVCLLILLTSFLGYTFAQNKLILKAKYKPETAYNQTIEQSSKTEVLYSGSEDFLNKLKDKGIVNPTILIQQSKIDAILKTEKMVNDTLFPLTIEFINSTSSDGKKAIPDGTIIYGHSSVKSMPTLDSMVSKNMDESIRKASLQLMQTMFSQIPFPDDKIVQIGDSFSVETPLTLPLSGMTVAMGITTYYKLLSIINGIGNFDIMQVYKMTSASQGFDLTASGSGKGQMFYDIKNEFYTKYHVDMEILMSMKNQTFAFNIKTNSSIIQTIGISKNTK